MSELDLRILLALRSPGDLSDPVGPEWLERVAVDLTALGSHAVLVLLVLCATGWLLLARRDSTALWLILWSGGATLLNAGLKTVFARPRPEVVDHLVVVVTHSFPSGHALMSAAIYLMLAGLPGHELMNPRLRHYLVGLAVLLTLLIGISRVYLGVHWPSDVLGGWFIGSLWAWVATRGAARGRP
jgi:undecaprenyl-diphosphatase